MRYLDGQPEQSAYYAGTNDFVGVTVFLTLLIGILFVVAGWKGRQIWLGTWGVLTLIACAVYYLWAFGFIAFA